MALTTKSKIENYIGVDIASSLESYVTSVISIVTDWISRYCNKSFEASSTSDRYFDGSGSDTLLADSFVSGSITSLQLLDSNGDVTETIASGDYITYPLNDTEKHTIKLRSKTFPTGDSRIKITAKWGAMETPTNDIIQIATQLSAKIIERSLNGGQLSEESIGDHSVTFKEIDDEAEALGIKQTLDMYRHIPI